MTLTMVLKANAVPPHAMKAFGGTGNLVVSEVLDRQLNTAKNKSHRKWWEKIVFRKNVSINSPAIRWASS
jgi:hypothetical protein